MTVEVKVNKNTSESVATQKATDNRTAAREFATNQRGSLEEFARQKFQPYRPSGQLQLPKEVKDYFKSIGIHAGWVAVHRHGRLAEMVDNRGYRELNEIDLPPELRTVMTYLKRPDGSYSSASGDLRLMVVPKTRQKEIKGDKEQLATEKLKAAEKKISDNKDFYNNSRTTVEYRAAPRARVAKTQE